MKRATRILLRVSAAIAAVVILMVLISVDGVDHRPYFREAYYAETTARLHASTATNNLVQGPLAAGFGRALLSPSLNASTEDPINGRFHSLPLAGYGGRRGRPATGIHDDVYLKAIAIRVEGRLGVMVGADALIVPSEVTEAAMQQLAREFQLSRDQLYLSATHTHSSLGGWGKGKVAEGFAGGFQEGSRTWFASRIVAAVREAIGDLKPARFGSGQFEAGDFIRNRLVGRLGQVDPQFSYMVLKQDEGRTAILGSYSAHATVLSSDMMEFSADYPGYWQRAVEQATGGIAVFLAGSVGSQSPTPPAGGFAGAERMGQALAQRLLDRLPATELTNAIVFGRLGLEISLPPLNTRLTDNLRLRPWIAEQLLPVRKTSFIQVFRLNNSVWISTPCDFSAELALGIKEFLQAKGKNGVITSFNGDYIGYVIPSRYYHLNGYEPRLMSFFGPNTPDYFDELIRAMAMDLIRPPGSG